MMPTDYGSFKLTHKIGKGFEVFIDGEEFSGRIQKLSFPSYSGNTRIPKVVITTLNSELEIDFDNAEIVTVDRCAKCGHVVE